ARAVDRARAHGPARRAGGRSGRSAPRHDRSRAGRPDAGRRRVLAHGTHGARRAGGRGGDRAARPGGSMMTGSDTEARARRGLVASGGEYELTRHGRVGSLAEAATARGLEPHQILKTLVVRRGADDFLFVLVPGGRTIAWARLRS